MRALFLAALLCAGIAGSAPAPARDDGPYAQAAPGERDWIRGLTNKHGFNCCDTADGTRLEDPDWELFGERGYRVRLEGVWVEVPPEAVIREPNRLGYAIVWRFRGEDGALHIRCFLAGAQT